MKKLLVAFCIGATVLLGCSPKPVDKSIAEIAKPTIDYDNTIQVHRNYPSVICEYGYLFFLYRYSQNPASLTIEYQPVFENNRIVKCKDE